MSEARVAAALGVLAVDRLTAEVVAAFEDAGIRTVLLKGPSLQHLYPGQVRPYGDSDLLVAPDQRSQAGKVLRGLGFTSRKTMGPGPSHAVTWDRRGEVGSVDLHHTIPGAGVSPERLWAIVSETVDEATVAGRRVAVPSPAMRLLHLALHAAQHGRHEEKTTGDLRRALSGTDRADWEGAADLARDLEAVPALVAGLGLVPAGADVLDRLGFDAGELTVDAAVRLDGPGELGRLHRLASQGRLRDVVGLLWAHIATHPDAMRRSGPRIARRGRLGLVLAYVVRILQLAGRMLRAVPTYLRLRRRHRTSVWARLRPLLGDRPWRIGLLAGLSVVAGLLEAAVLAVVAQIAVAMVEGSGRVATDLGPVGLEANVGTLLAVAAGLAAGRFGLHAALAWLPARISADVQARLRRDLYEAFTGASWQVQAEEREGHLQELMTTHVGRATQAVLSLATGVSAAFTFAALIVSALLISVPVALLVLAVAVVLFALLRPLTAWGRRHARAHSQAHVDHATAVSETVRMAEETQVFGSADARRRQMGTIIEATRRAFFRTQLAGRLAQSAYQGLVILLVVGALAGLWLAGPPRVAALGAVVLIMLRSAAYGQQLQAAYHQIRETGPYLERLREAETRFRASTPRDDGVPVGALRRLVLDDVSFSYRPGVPVLRDVDLTVEAGEALGLVGPSGGGKSTVVQLLLRLREPDAGRFLVDGRPAEQLSRARWQRRVAYVPQEPRLLHATVADNIRHFRDLDDAAVERAARLAEIHQDIVGWTDGYETVIGQRADAVSGGQRQRICLARALAGEPDLLVLDEPTSALDPDSEAALVRSLARLKGRLALVVVAHRRAVLELCDRVVTLDGGRIVEEPGRTVPVERP